MDWHLNWNYMIIGAIIAAGGVAGIIYRQKKKKISFEEYCAFCKKLANAVVESSPNDVIKAVLVLEKVGGKKIVPTLYCRYSNGKIMKKCIGYEYSLDLCPVTVQDAIMEKKDYILNRY